MPPANRQEGGQRCYGEEDVRRLTFIRRCRDFALPIEQVRTLVSLMRNGDGSCREARDVAERHLVAMRAKLVELEALERTVARLVDQPRKLPNKTVDLSSGDLSLEELLGLADSNSLRVIARSGESCVVSRLVS